MLNLSLRLAVSLFVSTALFPQEFRATLTGRITDPSGAAIPGAKVNVKSVSTAAVFASATDEDGVYRIPFLNPGDYTMTVEKTGFQRAVREGVNLQVNARGVVDVILTLGETTQSITVEGGAALLETETADRGLNIESKRVLNTPLQGRNIFAQAWSAPGVAVTAAVQRLRPFDIAGSSGISVSGGRPSGNEVLVDGVSNLARASTVTYVPTAEATGEFRVQTTSYDAQYGWTTGGVINVTTKSGGNEFHGSAFEFLQNTVLNANTFDSNRNTIPRQASHINTFGGDIGGPILKNKLFAHFSYEQIRQVIPDPFSAAVPTALQKAGDFSQTYYARTAGQLQLQTIYDPFSTTDAGVRQPFTGNRIPANLINPVAAKVLSFVPEGNVAGDPVTGLSNLANSGNTRQFTDFFPEYTTRVDYNISERTRMFVRYSRNKLSEERDFRYSTRSQLNVADTSSNSPFKRENHSATIQATRTLNATTVLDFRLGLARFLALGGSSIGKDYDLASLGFSPQYARQAVAWFPRFLWSNYQGAGGNPSNNDPIAQTNSVQGSLSKIMGRQSIKTGGEFRLQRAYLRNPGFLAGQFDFTPLFTGRSTVTVDPASGNGVASFLLGTPQTGLIDVNNQPARQQRLFSFYIQDDIRITPKLKVNAGLRWDYLGPMTDRFDALTRGFDRTSASPLQAPGLQLKGGVLYAGAGGQDRGIYKRDWNNFGPRFGAAYQITSKTVVRGGYGLIYAQSFDDPGLAPGYSQRTSMVTFVRAGVPQNTLTNPFPDGILQPVGNRQGLATFLGQGFDVADPNRVLPWTHQFSFEVQRELPGQFLVTLGYVGSRIRGLPVDKQINDISRESLALGSATLTASVPNPMAGLIPGTALNAATVQRQQLLRPFPQFTAIRERFRSEGTQSYNALQALLYKRLSSGLNFSVAYTYSKTIESTSYNNPQDDRLERVVSIWDVPHSLQINGVYELPFGKGKPFGAGAHTIVNRLIGGWEISGIMRLQAGQPTPGPNNGQWNAVPTGVSPVLENPTLDRWFNTCTLLANGSTRGCLAGEQPVWTIQPALTLRTWASRIDWVRRPTIGNLDFSIIKNNHIGERINFILRGDFLNATNTPQFFNGPVTDVNNANFGRIAGATVQSNLPRFIQVSAKIQF